MIISAFWALGVMAAAPTGPTKPIYDAGSSCGRRIGNNDILEPEVHIVDSTYNHQLTIKNGTRASAVVKVQEKKSGAIVRFFVENGGTATILVDDGSYEISYAIGGKLAADCSSVIRPLHVAKFPGVHDLYAEHRADSYSTGVLELTLYTVRHGNVSTRSIPVGEFNRD